MKRTHVLGTCILTTLALGARLVSGPALLPAQRQHLEQVLHPDILVTTDPMAGKFRSVLRSRTVRVDIDLLARLTPRSELSLELFDDLRYTARFERRELVTGDPGGFTWYGSFAGLPGSQFILTVVGDGVSGWFYPGNHSHVLVLQGAPGTHCVREMDALATTTGSQVADGLVRAGLERRGNNPAAACTDNPYLIQVMLPYTTMAASQAGGSAKLFAMMNSAVALANSVCANSGMRLRFARTARYRGYGYTSTKSLATELELLTFKKGHPKDPNGVFDTIHTLRQQDGADLVTLLVGNHPAHGSWRSTAWDAGSNPALGFGVAEWNEWGNYSTLECAGFNMGCRKNRENEPPSRQHFHAHAFWWKYYESGFPSYKRRYFYTVMSSISPGSCSFPWSCDRVRVPHFSNPQTFVQFSNGRFNVGNARFDNRRMIEFLRPSTSNFSHVIRGWNRRPGITRQPQGKTFCLGVNSPSIYTMSVTATGAQSYQWRKNGRAISGARSASYRLTVSNVTTALAGRYDCLVTNPCGTTTTAPAVITVNSACRVTNHRFSVPRFGDQVASIGDFDGDGYGDFAASGTTYRTANDGVVRVYSGKAGAVLATWWGAAGDQFGAQIAGAGDVDQDGRDDIVISAPSWSSGKGRITVISGRTRSNIRSWTGAGPGRTFGSRIAAGGDLNGDGHPDVVTVGDTNRQLIAFSGKNSAQLWQITVDETIGSLAIPGDFTLDGRDDVAIGLPGWNSAGGKVVFVRGRNGGGITAAGGIPGDRAGHAMSRVGDLNGDRLPEILVGTPGTRNNTGGAAVWSLAPNRGPTHVWTAYGKSRGQYFGWSLSGLGDWNGDRTPEIVVGGLTAGATVLSGRNGAKLREITPGARVSVAGIDSNGDAKGDLLIGYPNSRMVTVYDGGPRNNPPDLRAYSHGCATRSGRIGRLRLVGRGAIGTPVTTLLSGFDPNQAAVLKFGVQSWNFDYRAIGAPGCIETLRSILTIPTRTDSRGVATVSFTMANNTWHIGQTVYWGGAALAPRANLLNVTASNGIKHRIGRQ